MKGGAKVVVEKHRHEGIFVARGKEDALVTKNMVVGESVYGEKRISVDVRPPPEPPRLPSTPLSRASDFSQPPRSWKNRFCLAVAPPAARISFSTPTRFRSLTEISSQLTGRGRNQD